MKQPTDAERADAVSWIRGEIKAYALKNAGDPGRVTVRGLTSSEYAYTVKDLTGLDFRADQDFVADEVGGEGFTNFGDVQFLQDSSLERYLASAKWVAARAVIGAGPLQFYRTRPHRHGVVGNRPAFMRSTTGTASGRLREKAGRRSAWTATRRRCMPPGAFSAALGEPRVTLAQLSAREGLLAPFVEHIGECCRRRTPSSRPPR